jgi:hypothetical protein
MTKKQTIITCIVLLLLTTNCTRRANQESQTKQALANTMQPVRVSAENVDAAEPAVAAARDGSVYVAWIEHRAKREADVFVAHLDGEGRTINAPVRVNPKIGEAKGWRGDPPTIAVAPDKTVYVGWTARVGTAEGHAASDLYLSASRDEGLTFGPPVKVNDDERPAAHGMHSLVTDAKSHVYLAWLDERNVALPPQGMKQQAMEHMEANSEVFFAVSADGGRSFSKNVRLASEVCPCCKTALAVGPSNQLYVSWRQVLPGDFRHIAVAASRDGGQSFAPSQIVSDDGWKITGCPVSGPTLAVTGDNSLRVAWYTAGERGSAGLYWAESRDNGQTFSERKLLADGQVNGNPHLLADWKNNLFAVWQSDEKEPRILSARLSTDGVTTAAMPLASSAELPAVAAVGEKLLIGYIVSVKDQRSIWITRADSNREEEK